MTYDISDGFNRTEISIIRCLLEKENNRSYMADISRRTGKSIGATFHGLKKLEKKGIIEPDPAYKREIQKGYMLPYLLTDLGRAFGWVFKDPDVFLELYRFFVEV